MYTITTQTACGTVQRFSYATHKAAHITARALARQASHTTRITLRGHNLTVSY